MRARLPLSVIFGLLITLLTQSSYANELLIWDKLQGSAPKGYVLLLRHTLAPGVGDPENFKLNDCATQRNLSEVGRQDAKEVGEWLKRRELKIFRVESSRWCRAKETAQLLNLGKVKLNKNLDSLFEESDIANHPATKQVRKQILKFKKQKSSSIFLTHNQMNENIDENFN